MESIARQYESQTGVRVEVAYGGSKTLLEQMAASPNVDLYIAADAFYVTQAQQRGLCDESATLVATRPVVVVPRDSGLEADSLKGLLRPGLRVAMASPDSAAIGRTTRQACQAAGIWDQWQAHVQQHGVMHPTVGEVMTSVLAGGADAGIVWDVMAAHHEKVRILQPAEFNGVESQVVAALCTHAPHRREAEALLEYLRTGGRDTLTNLEYSAPSE